MFVMRLLNDVNYCQPKQKQLPPEKQSCYISSAKANKNK